MNIQQFNYVLAVAEHRHFELAAEKCCISQSTLSTMISRFEDELSLKIFDRSKKPVEITAEGRVVIEQLKIITGNIGQLGELVRELKGEVKGQLSMAVIPTIAPFLLPLFLQDFAAQFPELHIDVREQTTDEIIRQISARELDIGIVSTPLHEPELLELKLYNEPFVLYDAGKKNKDGSPLKKMDLSNMWLMEEGHCLRTQALHLCELNKKQGPRTANFNFKAGSIDSLLRFVKANKACTLLPWLSVLNFSDHESRDVKRFADPPPVRTVGLVVHKHFVKQRILELIQQEIITKVQPLLSKNKARGKVLSPL